MAEKKLLLGDEAIALGAIHAGISGVYAYPGTPSTEITEFIQNNPLAKERKLHSTWCTNEKTAMEAALGMSYAGKRALVCMKHVGMNVAADAFVNSAITGVNGGLVVLAAGAIEPFMPWLLSFAAGTMMYVVTEELIPEAHLGEHSNAGTLSVMAGFVIMMILDVALG